MRRAIMLCVMILCASGYVFAQGDSHPTGNEEASSFDVQSYTPEMRFYVNEREHYQNPLNSVRRNAEHRAAQRRNRLAAMKWFGISNSRPQANPTPWTGTMAPARTGIGTDLYRWHGYVGSYGWYSHQAQ